MNKFIKFFSLLFVSLSLVESLSGQSITVRGTVRDKTTNLPIDSTRIELIDKSNPFKRDTVFTDAQGNWIKTLQTTSINDETYLPVKITLSQNYPNPFNPSTKFDFSISQSGEVKISVYDILGKLIESKTFNLPVGNYTIDWFSKGSAGVLIYAIEFKDIRLSKKMIQLDGGGNGGLGNIYINNLRSNTINTPITFNADYDVIAYKLGYYPDTLNIVLFDNIQIDLQIETVHRKALVIDLHNDVLEKVVDGYQLGIRHSYNHSDIPRFFEGGIDAQMLALWADPNNYDSSYKRTMQMVDSFKSQLALNQLTMGQAKNSDEIAQLNSQNKFAGILCVEGGHSIENSIEKLKTFYQLGARYMTITWNNSTSWATSAADPQSQTKGLSEFGKQVIKSMDSLGMIIDVSHVGIKTIQDILATTKNPIIASHSGVRALRNHYRNLTDDQIRSIAQGGGVIGVVFYPSFLTSKSPATIDTVIKHIDYIRNLVGIDHIAIGSDFDGIETTPVGLEDVSKLPNLTMALLRKGYTISDVMKILGGNYLRVFKKVCN